MNNDLLNLLFASVGAITLGIIVGKIPAWSLAKIYGNHYKGEFCGQTIYFRTKSKEAATVLLTIAEEVKLKYITESDKPSRE
jgi:hypothetical protein